MASVNNLYIKRTDFTSMTGDMTFENVKGFYYEGSFYKDFKELYIDGNDLVVITNINNYKIASTNHVWNLVYIDNTWLHLDLTWDDPVSEDNEDILDDKYFLISTDKLLTLDKSDSHHFNKNLYLETK